MLGTPISAGLGSMDLGERDREREKERDEGILGLNFGYGYGYGSAGLPGLGSNGLPGLGPNGVPGLPGLGPNGISGLPGMNAKSPTGSASSKGMVTSLPPPPRSRRAGSVSHVLPGRTQEEGSGLGMGRVQEEGPGGRAHTTEGTLRREDLDNGGGSRRPSLVPMMSLSFGQVEGFIESPSAKTEGEGDDTDGEYEEQGATCQREPRVLPPQLAPPSAPLPLPPGSWPAASDSSQASMYSVQTTSTSTGARLSDMRASLDARPSGSGGGPGLDRSRVSLGDGPRPNVSWSQSRVSLGESPGASGAHSRVSLALVRGMLAEHPEGDGWDDGAGSLRESPTWASVRESPSRTRESPSRRSTRGTSPIAFTRQSTTDSLPSSPSTPAIVADQGPSTSVLPRETFGSAFLSREIVEPDLFSHPFASQGRRAHRRAGSYGGPTLFTIADSPPVSRSKSQRSKSELPPPVPPPTVPPPPVPPPNMPLPPLPSSRPGTPSGQAQPRHTSLRTRLRMLSAPSPAPQSALPDPPRDLGALAEDDLIQPISKVPISLLVKDDSSARRGSINYEHQSGGCPKPEGATSLPPPPRIRMVRQHSHSASSDREGLSDGRRSDESGVGGSRAVRDSAVHLENRGSD
ncbi:hypothetical protein FRC12_001297 [Ceratobasidium sp. 428]|nr:hypothetical protein FRC12_001297 [Ceratobasidium sp. 428]